jgi:hypothetical protein
MLNRGPPKRRRVLYRSIVFGMQQFLLRFRWKSTRLRVFPQYKGGREPKQERAREKMLFRLGFISFPQNMAVEEARK